MKSNLNIKQILLSKVDKFFIADNSKDLNTDDFIDDIAKNIKNGSKMVILKTEKVSSKVLVKVGLKIQQLCSMFDVVFIVEDRADIAKILDCNGIILTSNSYSLKNAKKILDSEKLIGFLGNKIDFKVDNECDFYIFDNKVIYKKGNNFDNK